MRILRPIVQPFVLAVFHVQAHVLARCAVGVDLVRDHYARRPRGLPEQLPHKPLRGDSISSALNEDVENEAILIDGAPEPMLLAGDCDDKSSGPGELHPQALTDPDVSVSTHPAPTVQPVNGFALPKGSSRMAVDLSIKPDSVAPSLQRHYSAFITTTRNSAPVLRIGTRVLMVLPLGHLP